MFSYENFGWAYRRYFPIFTLWFQTTLIFLQFKDDLEAMYEEALLREDMCEIFVDIEVPYSMNVQSVTWPTSNPSLLLQTAGIKRKRSRCCGGFAPDFDFQPNWYNLNDKRNPFSVLFHFLTRNFTFFFCRKTDRYRSWWILYRPTSQEELDR
jgi:hypothetical protein